MNDEEKGKMGGEIGCRELAPPVPENSRLLRIFFSPVTFFVFPAKTFKTLTFTNSPFFYKINMDKKEQKCKNTYIPGTLN